MAVLDVAQIEVEETALIVVFVPPETTFFHDRQRIKLRELLINALVSSGLTGELLAAWEFDGHLHFMGNPRWSEYLENTNFTELYARKTRQITC